MFPARPLRPGRLALALGLAAAIAPAARADNLDARLLRETPEILQTLRENGHRNVGILHFRVDKGRNTGPKQAFGIGTIADSLAERLENALVLCDRDKDPLNVIHDASTTAAAAKVGAWFHKPAEQARLFKPQYPLAWGTKTVQADAFLTGYVRVPDSLEKATVVVEMISANRPTVREKVKEFDVPTDRSLLHDLGQSFTVARRGVAKNPAALVKERNAQAIASARKRDLEPADPPRTALDLFGLDFQILYDGQPQTVRGDPQSAGELQVNPVNAGQRVSFLAGCRPGTEPRALVIKINGKSLWQMEEAEGALCRKWIIGPGVRNEFVGFYQDTSQANVIPFKVLTEEESATRAAEFGGRVGVIDVEVFATGETPQEADPITISMRGVSRRSMEGSHKPADRAALKGRILQGTRLQSLPKASLLERGLIVGDTDAPPVFVPVTQAEFPNPHGLGMVAIRYYTPTPGQTVSP